jgi:hypothetical protein
MAEKQICEVETTLAPLNIVSYNDIRWSKQDREYWHRNYLYYVKRQRGGSMKQKSFTRIRVHQPIITSNSVRYDKAMQWHCGIRGAIKKFPD